MPTSDGLSAWFCSIVKLPSPVMLAIGLGLSEYWSHAHSLYRTLLGDKKNLGQLAA